MIATDLLRSAGIMAAAFTLLGTVAALWEPLACILGRVARLAPLELRVWAACLVPLASRVPCAIRFSSGSSEAAYFSPISSPYEFTLRLLERC